MQRLWTQFAEATRLCAMAAEPRDRETLPQIHPPARFWRARRYAELPDGKSLCFWDAIDGMHWFVCTLVERDGALHMVEPLDQIATYGDSLRVLIVTALANDGDISEQQGSTLASLWEIDEATRVTRSRS